MSVANLVKSFVKTYAPPQAVNKLRAMRYQNASSRAIFTRLYYEPKRAAEMISGPGSDLLQTTVIAAALPQVIEELGAKSLLDAPCGDFYWMRRVDLGVERYVGVDVVQELITRHAARHASAQREFLCLDITRDALPRCDLIFSRDALVHLSNRDALAALANFKRSGARYLLMTTFPAVTANADILTGEWRPINFQLSPFNLPAPLKLINEQCTENDGRYADKSLGLWALANVPELA